MDVSSLFLVKKPVTWGLYALHQGDQTDRQVAATAINVEKTITLKEHIEKLAGLLEERLVVAASVAIPGRKTS